jgi:hypothetical protein
MPQAAGVRTQVCTHCAMHTKKVTMINQRLIMQCRIVYTVQACRAALQQEGSDQRGKVHQDDGRAFLSHGSSLKRLPNRAYTRGCFLRVTMATGSGKGCHYRRGNTIDRRAFVQESRVDDPCLASFDSSR